MVEPQRIISNIISPLKSNLPNTCGWLLVSKAPFRKEHKSDQTHHIHHLMSNAHVDFFTLIDSRFKFNFTPSKVSRADAVAMPRLI